MSSPRSPKVQDAPINDSPSESTSLSSVFASLSLSPAIDLANTPEPNTLTKFTLFPKLPTELRLKIWRRALPPPFFIHLAALFEDYRRYGLELPRGQSIQARRAIPPDSFFPKGLVVRKYERDAITYNNVLRACQESREVYETALPNKIVLAKKFTNGYELSPTDAIFRFGNEDLVNLDFEYDEWIDVKRVAYQWMAGFEEQDWMKGIKHLRLPLLHPHESDNWNWDAIFKVFKGVTQMEMMFCTTGCRGHRLPDRLTEAFVRRWCVQANHDKQKAFEEAGTPFKSEDVVEIVPKHGQLAFIKFRENREGDMRERDRRDTITLLESWVQKANDGRREAFEKGGWEFDRDDTLKIMQGEDTEVAGN